MSEEKPVSKRNRINLEKVQEFFDTQKISIECPICKNDKWSVPYAQSIGGNTIPWGSGDGNMFMTGIPVLVMVCSKCKFVRQHSLVDNDIPGAVEEF
jgi:hypothetical protein